MTVATKDQQLIYAWGKAYHELKDNPYFKKYQQMLKEMIDRLQESVCNDDPENAHELRYETIMVHRAGQVKGLKNLLLLQEQYHTNFLNHNETEDFDEDVENDEEKPGGRGSDGSRRRKR